MADYAVSWEGIALILHEDNGKGHQFRPQTSFTPGIIVY